VACAHVTYLVEHQDEMVVTRRLSLAAGEQQGLRLPSRHSGAEARGFQFNATVMEEFTAVDGAIPGWVDIHCDVSPLYLVCLGTSGQQERWLRSTAIVEVLTAIAMAEPRTGSGSVRHRDIRHLRRRSQAAHRSGALTGRNALTPSDYEYKRLHIRNDEG
jgi:alkylation response protein AidB-like acyl-CoA dehydrogenase